VPASGPPNVRFVFGFAPAQDALYQSLKSG
jgi:hypothetical protein